MAALATAIRYWETLRRLRPVQLYGRVWFNAAKPSAIVMAPPSRRFDTGTWVGPARRQQSLVSPTTLTLLNRHGDLTSIGWDGSQHDKLWRYNQHYFDDLNAIDAGDRTDWHRALLLDWIAKNPPGRGTAWEPYPTSLRIVNWIKWALAGNHCCETILSSLATQTRWLSRRLEWHLLGNHLFANAKALIFAGLFFDGPEPNVWRRNGFRILSRQTDEQVLGHGGQFELSPMYHAIAFEDVLDLINVSQQYAPSLLPDQKSLSARWRRIAPSMERWLNAMSHPDGDISFFNDGAFAIAPSNEELFAYARRLDLEEPPMLGNFTQLGDMGYARLAQPDAVLIADVARVGPDYLPGHAHADTLSFEASLFGQRLFVNSGTSIYGTGSERLRQRGTAAHNTVVVDGANSSDVWSGFRVGARASPFDVRADQRSDALILEGSHDGYKRLAGAPIHTRRWELRSSSMHVSDKLSDSRHTAEARYHLHPDVQLAFDSNQTGEFILKDGKHVRWTAEGGPARAEKTTWHPEFGKSIDNTCLVLPLVQGRAVLDVSWA
jgi:uncharacterized heparinase superfamily protein